MPFCKYCGKQLADGEVCSCQSTVATNQEVQAETQQMGQMNSQVQAEAQQMGQMNNQVQTNQMNGQTYYQQPNPQVMQAKQAAEGFLKKVPDSILHPVTSACNCTRESSNFGLTAILVNLCLTLIGLIFLCLYIKGKLGMFGGTVPYAKLVLGCLILSAVNYFGYAASYLLTTKIIFKSDLSFKNSMNIISSKAVWDIVVVVAASLFLVLNAKAGAFIFVVGALYSLLVMLYSYSETVNISSDKKVYAMFISIIIIFFVTSILCKFIFGDSANNLVDSLKSFM